MKKMLLLIMLLVSSGVRADLLEKQPYDVTLGNENAAVTVIEYFSLSCPHCADFQEKTFPKIHEKYIETGKIRFFARPYAVDKPSLMGSRILQCVAKEKYYPFIKVMLKMQDSWVFLGNPEENLRTITKVGGLSDEEFDKCLNDKQNEDLVLQIRQQAETELKIDAIPILFVNGVPLRGAGNFDDIAKVIDDKLNKVKSSK